jgi:GntR family negative regulator for fad regulon and positive regulator of fabA
MDWHPAPKPAELAETRLLAAILDGRFPVNSALPGERDLAGQLGVTRPTLREALQRLARDGWVEIQHGKPTRVRDYWHEGNLAVLATIAQAPARPAADFVGHLLEVRALLAPAYTRQALERASAEIADLLAGYELLADTPAAFARADWNLHRLLTRRAANPVFPLLLNSFESLSIAMGEPYFTLPECRQHSRTYYRALLRLARSGAAARAETLTRGVMQESLALWRRLSAEGERA